MIFPDKPRPPWQYTQPRPQTPRAVVEALVEAESKKQPKPPGYYRERIEFALIVIGLYFWIQYWMQYQ